MPRCFQPSDKVDLVRKAQCSVSETTEEVWKSFHAKLLRFIRKRVNNDVVAEDILQDVFVKIYRNIDSIREGKKLESWIYQVTRNTIIDHYRSRKEHAELPENLSAPEPQTKAEDKEELSACMASLLSHLPDKYRTAVQLCDVQGKSQKVLAETEKISLSGAKSRVQRGREQLRQLLHDCCECKSRRQLTDCADGDCELC